MSSSGDLRFPLEERFLARVRISSNRFEDWKATAQREVLAVLDNPKSWYYRPNDLKASYRPAYEQDAIRGFMRLVDNTLFRDVLSLAHLEINLDDIQHGLLTPTTNDFRVATAHIQGEAFMDAAVLKLHEGPNANDAFHFVGLKWVAYASPAVAVIGHRDYVYFEHSGTMQDNAGRTVLFVFQKSFPLHGEELIEPDKGCVRGQHFQLALFRMEGGGVLYQAIGQLDPAENVPTWASTRYMTEYFDSVKKLVTVASARAVYSAGMLKQAAAPKSSVDNKACIVCQKKFSMLRSRHGCRNCGQSMCKHCITTLTLFNDEAQFASVPVALTETFCQSCIRQARSRRDVDHLSATLTKTTLAAASEAAMKSDAISSSVASYAPTMPSVSSPYDSSMRGGGHYQQQHYQQQPPHISQRSSIERSQHSESSSASGSNRSMPMMQSGYTNDDAYRSPASSHTSSTRTQNSLMFEQMNESIRQQEELLQVIQQERAKMQARQQAPPPPPPPYYAQPVPAVVVTHVVQDDAPISPSSHIDDEDRFQVLV